MAFRHRSFLTAALFWCAASAPLHAQHPQVREGFWIGFGFGGGSAKLDCDSCASNSEDGFAGFLKMGGTVSPHILVGGESNGWTKQEGGVTTNLGNVSATIYYYPNAAGGFFLRGGFGFAAYSADAGGGNKLTGTGLGFTLGLGYDFRVARNFSLTPVFNISAGSLGELQINSNPSGITGVKESVAQVGLGFTWH